MKRAMHAGDIQAALIKYVCWWQNIVVPEFSIDGPNGDRADLIQITKSGFAVEYEIKTSTADWRKDLEKPKWVVCSQNGSRYVSRFFYVVPGKVVEPPATDGLALGGRYAPAIKPPERLPPGVGIILVLGGGYCHEHVAAKRYRVPPLPEEVRRRALECFYYRFWRLRVDMSAMTDDYHSARLELNEFKRQQVELEVAA